MTPIVMRLPVPVRGARAARWQCSRLFQPCTSCARELVPAQVDRQARARMTWQRSAGQGSKALARGLATERAEASSQAREARLSTADGQPSWGFFSRQGRAGQIKWAVARAWLRGSGRHTFARWLLRTLPQDASVPAFSLGSTPVDVGALVAVPPTSKRQTVFSRSPVPPAACHAAAAAALRSRPTCCSTRSVT